MSRRALVTGAAGFVGDYLLTRLVDGGFDVVATDVEPEPDLSEGVTYRRGDVTDPAFLSTFDWPTFDLVFHLAAVVGVNRYLERPFDVVDVNVTGTRQVLERVQDVDARFVFTSTSEVYGRNPSVPWSETADRVLGPTDVDRWSYSTSKALCEHLIWALVRSEGPLSATVVRPFNLYGPGQEPNFVIPAFAKAVATGGVPSVYDDGSQTRCFTHVSDFVDGLVAAATETAGRNEAFNIGSQREISIRDLAELTLEVGGAGDRSPEFVDTDELYGERYEDIHRRVPDTSKAQRLLDWAPETPLEVGVEQVIEWFRMRAEE